MSRQKPFVICIILFFSALAAPCFAQETVNLHGLIKITGSEENISPKNTIVVLESPKPEGIKRRKPQTFEVRTKDKTFDPKYLSIQVGDSISYPNFDNFNHNVFSRSIDEGFDLGSYPYGAQRAYKFEKSGMYKVYCNIHVKMASFVMVANTPWSHITDASGTFSFTNIPPGSYTLRAWNIRGEVRVPIKVPSTATQPLEVLITSKGSGDETHLNKFGRPYAEAEEDEIY